MGACWGKKPASVGACGGGIMNQWAKPGPLIQRMKSVTRTKPDAYKAASELLGRNDDAVLRYVALELRRCIEAVVYEKLVAYGDLIPAEAARTWQAPQAFKALLAVEPYADKTATIAIGPQTEPAVPSSGPFKTLGVDLRPKAAWLQKTWNKLGSFLHADWPFAESGGARNQGEFFLKMLAELDPFVASSFTMTFATRVTFNCSECGGLVKTSERNLEATGTVTCLKCFTRFSATKSGDQFIFHPEEPAAALQCGECREKIFLPARDLEVGYRFSCGKCGCGFEIRSQGWMAERTDSTLETRFENPRPTPT